MGSTIAASTLSALHVGNDQINGVIAGLVHGNVGKVVKSAVETGVGMGVGAGADALAKGGGSDAVMTGAMLLAAAPGIPGGRGKKGGHGSTTSRVSTDPAGPHKGEHKGEHTSDTKAEKKKDKKDGKDGKDNGNDKSPKVFVPPADNDAFTRGIKHM